MSTTLADLTAHLNRWFGPARARPSSAALAQALASAPDPHPLKSEAQFGEDSYRRVTLHRTEHYELRLICWKPGQSSALHGHGASACAFRVLSGEATELRIATPTARLGVDDVGLAEEGLVHQVANLGDTDLITLHVYAPPLPIDQPSATAGRSVVIIGGGWCGTAQAIHLLQTRDPSLRITLVERGPVIGRGVAYDTPDPGHVLNVPASKMSVDPAHPGEFLQFARTRTTGVHGHALLSRRLYGDYVQARLRSTIVQSPSRLRLARTEATRVTRTGEGWSVELADGRVLPAETVILASGHGPTRLPEALLPHAAHPRIIANPYAPGALAGIPHTARVLVLGTGLTAIDALLSLRAQGVQPTVHAVSRNGWWPRPHLESVGWTGPMIDLDIDRAPTTADGLADWLKAEVARAWQSQIPWQAVLGAVRPFVSTIWARLSDAERSRFLKVHRPAWEVFRHRVPRATDTQRKGWEAEGWLATHKGGLQSLTPAADGFVATLGDGTTLFADHIVVATGNSSDPREFAGPLWPDLLEQGLVTADPHGLGLRTDADGATLDAKGLPTGLWALGGLQRPLWFESSAVPELAEQVARLTTTLQANWIGSERAPAASYATEVLAVLP